VEREYLTEARELGDALVVGLKRRTVFLDRDGTIMEELRYLGCGEGAVLLPVLQEAWLRLTAIAIHPVWPHACLRMMGQ